MSKSEHEALILRVLAYENRVMLIRDVIDFIFPDLRYNVGASYVRHLILDKLDSYPPVEVVPRDEYEALLKRFRHLLESEYIRSFDEVDQKTGTYKRDILEADEPLKTHHSNLLCFKHSTGVAYGKNSEIHKYFILDAESLNSGLSNLSGRLGWSVYMDRRYEKSIDRMVQGWINFDRVLTGDEIVKYHLVSEPID